MNSITVGNDQIPLAFHMCRHNNILYIDFASFIDWLERNVCGIQDREKVLDGVPSEHKRFIRDDDTKQILQCVDKKGSYLIFKAVASRLFLEMSQTDWNRKLKRLWKDSVPSNLFR
jgi:hypothetical protein